MIGISRGFASSLENGVYATLVGQELDRSNPDQVTLVTGQITQTYQYLYSRIPDTGGFDFWYESLFSGHLETANLVYSMALGAQSDDQVVLNNKLSAALYVNQLVDLVKKVDI